jgi:FdhE protein
MSANVEPDPTAIGNVATPPFVRLPDPARLFADRAARFRAVATDHQLEPYLRLLAGIAQAQSDLLHGLPEVALPAEDILTRAREHKMPPLDRTAFNADSVLEATLEKLLAQFELLDMPAEAKAALLRVKVADQAARNQMVGNVLADAIPVEAIAEHVFVAAACQVHFARLAVQLDPNSLQAIGDGVCPSCGGAPSTSVIVNWPNATGSRFCSCSQCATLWNYTRLQCTLCGSNKKMQYQSIEGVADTIKAEICDECRGFVKILYQNKDAALDPIADDVASLGIDLLVRELGFRRGGVNPFLIGY